MPPTHDPLVIDDTRSIPRTELEVRASRSGGPGGQHVNTSSTRIELIWDFEHSRILDDAARARLRRVLRRRLDASGGLRVVASTHRSQLQNRMEAEQRLALLVRRALHVSPPRRRSRPPRAATERRLSEKKLHSERKRHRRRPADE